MSRNSSVGRDVAVGVGVSVVGVGVGVGSTVGVGVAVGTGEGVGVGVAVGVTVVHPTDTKATTKETGTNRWTTLRIDSSLTRHLS